MVIKKIDIIVVIHGIPKKKKAKVERWLTTERPNEQHLIVKHNGEDWEVGSPDRFEVYKLLWKV